MKIIQKIMDYGYKDYGYLVYVDEITTLQTTNFSLLTMRWKLSFASYLNLRF